VSQRPGLRRNRLHCRCHCAGPVRNLRRPRRSATRSSNPTSE
jgi:hypothetical protein